MEAAINLFHEEDEFDCISTVSVIKEFMWLDGKALNYNPLNALNSQNLPDIEALNFGFTLIDRNDLIRYRNIIGKTPKFIRTTDIEAIDIDTPLDFLLQNKFILKQLSKLRTY